MFDLLANKQPNLKAELLSGLTVALALVPEAVAFAFIAGVEPLVGLYAAFIVCLSTAILGGRPGMISGATGALAVVMVSLVAEHGVQYLFAAVVLMGVLQILAGIFKLGKFIRIVPHPVMLGFVNGLAIVIFLAQMPQFQTSTGWLEGMPMFLMLGLVALTMGIIFFLPKLTKTIPSSLAAIAVVSAIVIGFGLDTRTVGDLASIGGDLPSLAIPSVPFTMETLVIIFPYSLVMAAVGLIESLLTLTLIDELTETRGKSNRECVGQGIANVVTGFFGGMGGCAMIGQSMINVNSGGRGRLSGIVAAAFLLMFILFASSLIEMIPIAALVGVMFMVVIGTFEWSSFRIVRRIPLSDALVIVVVSAVTVATDLAIAVVVGVILSALVFAWKQSHFISVVTKIDQNGFKIYELHGPLYFSSVSNFRDLFTPNEDPKHVVVEFRYSRVCDHSGIEAIDALAERYESRGKTLHLRHLSHDCINMLHKAQKLAEIDNQEDPTYRVVS
ncbi:SulP family inorganic anion transporter [Sansalvadorimonas sp. 2012CJ34-2]|uniref:SulP family inorganic anion transporter n=1 Tax=Parendozoicomonas callyspongiae TaxID=2942213 RepID=A0ABT0PJH7_9GAMM|nr:SulP family inorganic anion transporter [Sansalvadorimonas sp. 2012CJ34-2]MCL6271542.1 SulP family inorganic anion transporter [Sansalvadorimonas sp. 2012CJ34-2]